MLVCSVMLGFYDVQFDKSKGMIRISGRFDKNQSYGLYYKKSFIFKQCIDVSNDMSIPILGEEKLSETDVYEPPFLKGERLTYDVYYAGLKTGESVLTFHGERDLDGEAFFYITFSTELPFFKDYEEIYASKSTFLPVMINRRIIKLGGLSTEHIEERYDQNNFTVSISKRRNGPENNTVITKDAPIHNAILLPYYYRANPYISEKGVLNILLPTQEFNIKISGEDEIETPLGQYLADVFMSEPSKFTFYLSKDSERLPLKITSHTALNYTLILNSKDTQN